MSTPLLPTLLTAGLAASLRADDTGIAAEITHVAIGNIGYTPDPAQPGMYHEIARFPVAGGQRIDDSQIHLTALMDGEEEFWVREVGFVLSDGTVLAVWSHPTTALSWKGPSTTLLQAFDLLLTGVPPGSVTVVAGEPGLSLYFAGELASLARAIVRCQHRHITPLLT